MLNKFYKSLSPKNQAVALIVVGLGLIGFGNFAHNKIKKMDDAPAAQSSTEPLGAAALLDKYGDKNPVQLKALFKANLAEARSVQQSCAVINHSADIKVSQIGPVSVICNAAVMESYFVPYQEKKSTFSSAGGKN